MLSWLSSFISLTITREGGIRTTAGDIPARVTMFLGCLGFDIINIIEFTAWTWLLGHAKENLVLFLDSFHILFPFISVSDTAWQNGLCYPGPLPSHPWRIHGWTFYQINVQSYAIYTCDQSFLTSCTVLINAGHHDALGSYWSSACGPLGHQYLISYYLSPLRMYFCHNSPALP